MGFDLQLKICCFHEFCGVWGCSWQQQLHGFACSLAGADKATVDDKSLVAEALGEPDKATAAAPDAESKEEKPEATARPEVPAEQPAGQEGEAGESDSPDPAVTPCTPCADSLVLAGTGAATQEEPKADISGLPQPSESALGSGSTTAGTGGVLVSRAGTKLGQSLVPRFLWDSLCEFCEAWILWEQFLWSVFLHISWEFLLCLHRLWEFRANHL